MTAEPVPAPPAYIEGNRVRLNGGPDNGEWHRLTAAEAAQQYIAYHPGTTEPATSTTPIFDKAIGRPSPEDTAGVYRPRWNIPGSTWDWQPTPPARRH